jgi:hypothetical protein
MQSTASARQANETDLTPADFKAAIKEKLQRQASDNAKQ